MDAGVTENGIAVFSIEVSGGKPPYTYQWQDFYNGAWQNFIDAGRIYVRSYDEVTIQSPIEAPVRCIVTDANGNSVTSNKALCTIYGVGR